MKQIPSSLQEYARGVAGGLLFSLPLLYTMEVWWTGFIVQPSQLLLYVLVTFLLLLGYNRYAGMHEDSTWKEVFIDSVEEIGIGLVLSLVVLWMLGRIDFHNMRLHEIMGKVIIETMTVAIGVSVGTAQLGGDAGESEEEGKPDQGSLRDEDLRNIDIWGQVTLALCGSVLIAGNVAPTEEIPMITFETTPLRVLAIALVSLVLGAVILFFSDFKGERKAGSEKATFTIIGETCVAYIIALCSSAFMLWFFGRFEGIHYSSAISLAVVLGLPAMLGASAGRLLIK